MTTILHTQNLQHKISVPLCRKSQCNNHPFRGHSGSCFPRYSKVQTLLHLASHLHENSLAWKTYPGRGPVRPVIWNLPNGPSVSCASFGGSWCLIWHKGGQGVVGECYLGHGSSVSGGLARKLLNNFASMATFTASSTVLGLACFTAYSKDSLFRASVNCVIANHCLTLLGADDNAYLASLLIAWPSSGSDSDFCLVRFLIWAKYISAW